MQDTTDFWGSTAGYFHRRYLEAAGLPSDADLDAVCEEREMKERNAQQPNAITIECPVCHATGTFSRELPEEHLAVVWAEHTRWHAQWCSGELPDFVGLLDTNAEASKQ